MAVHLQNPKQLYPDSEQTRLSVSILPGPLSLREGGGVLEHRRRFTVRHGRFCGELGAVAGGAGQNAVGVP